MGSKDWDHLPSSQVICDLRQYTQATTQKSALHLTIRQFAPNNHIPWFTLRRFLGERPVDEFCCVGDCASATSTLSLRPFGSDVPLVWSAGS